MWSWKATTSKRLLVALQFFPGIKLKREHLESLLVKRKDVLLRFLPARDIGLVISSSSSENWSENRALFVEGFRWTPSASFSQVLLAFGVTSVARSLASNGNWTTRTGCRRCLWSKVFSKQRHCGDTFHTLWKFSRQIVQIFSETRTKLKTTAVVIFHARKIYAK